MDRKGWFLTCVVLAGLIGPLGLIWESWHREPSACPPCQGPAAGTPLILAQTGTCGYFEPMLNATCPTCGRLWYDAKAPEDSPTQRLFQVLPQSRYPTVFSDPRILAIEGVYSYHFWRP